jgi:outer membrane protein assembly factor BamD (BamD/ComL family)
MRTLRLELAETFLDKQNYTEAERYALDYQKHYPGSNDARYAGYIAIKANFLSKLTIDRDQTKTEATIKLAHDFLNKYPQESDYKQSVKDMMEICYKDLITSEMNVIQSQINKYKYSKSDTALTGAHKRIAYIKDKLLPYVKAEEPRVIQMELKLAQTSGKQDVIKALEQTLQTKYPQHSTQLAQAEKKWWHLF